MKAIVQRKELLELIGKVKPVIPGRATLPIIEGILFMVKGGKLWLTATNLDQVLTTRLPDQGNRIMGTGGLVVKPKELENFLKAVTADKVTLAVVKNTLKVEAGNAETVLEGYDPKDFPPIPKVEGNEFRIVALAEKLGLISFSMDTGDTRPTLEAVYFDPESERQGAIGLAAADGFRLAVTCTTISGKGKMPPMIVPLEAVNLIEHFGKNMVAVKAVFQGYKAAKYEGSALHTEERASRALFQLNGVTLITQCVKGTYPNYKALIPKGGTSLVVNTEEFRKALKVPMSVMTGDYAPILRLQSTGKELRMWYVNMETEKQQITQVKIPAEGKTKIGINPKFLKDLADRIGTETFTLKTTKPESPGVIANNKVKYVVMPMYVNWGGKKAKPVNQVPPIGSAPVAQESAPAPLEPEKPKKEPVTV